MKVAREVPGFDLVLFGHDHTRHAETITNVAGKQVVCLDPANNAMSVADAEITVTIDEHQLHGKKLHILQNKSVEGKIADVTDCPVDEKMLKIFEPQIAEVDKYVSKQIGTFKNTIYSRDSYFGSSAFNDFILNLELQITHADIAFNAPLQFNSSIQAGPIRVSDMFKLYKYENMLYTMRLSGREIKNYLEMSYDLWTNRMTNADDHLLLLKEVPGNGDDGARALFQNFSYNFDSAAGIRYTVDVTKPRGEKINILSMADGSAFDMDKDYSVALMIRSFSLSAGIPAPSVRSPPPPFPR
jgi:2',3'-cyclic-nucleotide 2'-phosphodiesterase/3'-nucleotidase